MPARTIDSVSATNTNTLPSQTPVVAQGASDAQRSPAQEAQVGVKAAGERAKIASRALARANRELKDQALEAMAQNLESHTAEILEANRADLSQAEQSGLAAPLVRRLSLDEQKIGGLAQALRALAALEDPNGEVLRGRNLPNGLRMRQERVPLGVVAAIYEARPNVTADIAGLAIKSGNAAILRGGSAARATNEVLVSLLRDALSQVGLPADAVQSIDRFGREGASALMRSRGLVDVLIPRGGHDLIQSVVRESNVPVIETGEGNVHIFLDESADAEKAVPILLNAKTQKPSVCNAVETLLIHRNAKESGEAVLRALAEAGVVLHADAEARELVPDLPTVEAEEADWETEYLDLEIAVRVVDGLEDAMEHIRRYTSGHTEAILTSDLKNADTFVQELDSAALIVNASTRFTDGGELGLGAEIGISTQKLHARGPMGLGELTTTRWVILGDGHIRG